MENSWKPGQKSAPAPASAPAPGPAGEKPDSKPGPGPAGKDKPGPSRPAAAGEKAPSSPKPAGLAGESSTSEKKASWIQRLAGKTQNESHGPGRPKKESESQQKTPLTEAEIEETARAVADLRIDTAQLLGAEWRSGAYAQDDVGILARGYRALVKHYQLRLPWWIETLRAELRYNAPRVQDPKVKEKWLVTLGFRKKTTLIDVKPKSSEEVSDGAQHLERRP